MFPIYLNGTFFDRRLQIRVHHKVSGNLMVLSLEDHGFYEGHPHQGLSEARRTVSFFDFRN